jgi:glycosyltransferase involved in cell wall biosynthesis
VAEPGLGFSIVLPCYNEAGNLPPLLERYRAVWEDCPSELILVDNGSTDGTADLLGRELARPELRFARAIRVPKNRGYGHGIHAGLLAARGELVGFSHADMQCDPADLFVAYHRLRVEPDSRRVLVKGKRARRPVGPSTLTHGMAAFASVILGRRLGDINAQPKVFHRDHLERLVAPPDGMPFDLYVLYVALRAGMTIATIPVTFGTRAHGRSKWAFSIASRYRTIAATMLYICRLRMGRA